MKPYVYGKLLRPCQTVLPFVIVSADTLASARRSIHGCNACTDNATVPFMNLLAGLIGRFDAEHDYMFDEGVECPSCSQTIASDTLVEVHFIAREALVAHA